MNCKELIPSCGSLLCLHVLPGFRYFAGDDFVVYRMNTATKAITAKFKGHTSPIQSIAIDPKKDFIAAVAANDTVMLWNIATAAIVHKESLLQGRGTNRSGITVLNRLQWSPHGGYLALPGAAALHCLERNTWERRKTFGERLLGRINAVMWAPDESCIVAVSSLQTKDTVSAGGLMAVLLGLLADPFCLLLLLP